MADDIQIQNLTKEQIEQILPAGDRLEPADPAALTAEQIQRILGS